MSYLPAALALAAVALALIAWGHYFWLIAVHRVPRRPRGHLAALGLATVLGVAGVIVGPVSGGAVSWLAVGLAPVTLGAAGSFVWLLGQAPLPDGELVVAIGDPLPAFTATDHRGEPFSSAQLAGERVLLKFFRGHW